MGEKPHYHGHRRRLRESFLESDARFKGFREHQIMELLLTLAIPRADVKGPAKALLQRFKTVRAVLDAQLEQLRETEGIGEVTPVALKIIRAAAAYYLQQSGEYEVQQEPQQLADYWRMHIGHLRHEVFEVAYLDAAKRLLPNGIERLQEGTLNRAAVYPRRVISAALRRNAAGLVLAHNHPNGKVEPSEADKRITRAIALAAETVELQVVDHLVVSPEESFSFRKAGLL